MNRSKSFTNGHMITGRFGESIAREYLVRMGYAIQSQNVRTPYGEIDLIARKDNDWIFVEVKTRRTKSLGPPEISVNERKRDHLLQAVLYYCQHNLSEDEPWRIDVIAVQFQGKGSPPEITHFENAILS